MHCEEFFEIVHGGDQEPLGANLLVTSKTELAKAQNMFDVADGWFDDTLPPGIDSSSFLGRELTFHQFLQ